MMPDINLVAVLVAGIFSVVVGAVWYGPLFGKTWHRLIGMSMEDMKNMKMTPVAGMIGGFITALLMAYVLAHGIVFGNAYLGTSGIQGGMQGAFWYWLGFAVPLTGAGYLWEGKSVKLWVLHAGYYLVALLGMGAILGGM